MHYVDHPVSCRWTATAIECYQRGCVCSGCSLEEYCNKYKSMKKEVIGLVRVFGRPRGVQNGKCSA